MLGEDSLGALVLRGDDALHLAVNRAMNSDPLASKKGTCASPAVAFAISVLPVPGAPIQTHPVTDECTNLL